MRQKPFADAGFPRDLDITVTERLVEVGNIVGIDVIDHIIVGENNYYSFRENELL